MWVSALLCSACARTGVHTCTMVATQCHMHAGTSWRWLEVCSEETCASAPVSPADARPHLSGLALAATCHGRSKGAARLGPRLGASLLISGSGCRRLRELRSRRRARSVVAATIGCDCGADRLPPAPGRRHGCLHLPVDSRVGRVRAGRLRHCDRGQRLTRGRRTRLRGSNGGLWQQRARLGGARYTVNSWL